jgi:hypothetical protein
MLRRATAALSYGDTDTSKLGGMRWLSAALIGLGGPMIAGLMFFPGMADGAKIAAFSGLGLLAVAAASIYTISVLIPGDVMGVEVNAATGTLDLVHQGAFASVRRSYALDDVRDLRLTKAYDRDGYGFEAPELVLDDGKVFALPGSMTAQDIAALRKAVGLPAAKR